VRGGGQGGCRGAAGEEKWGGCLARRAWGRAGAWVQDVPGGSARGGPAYSVELRDVEASLGAAVNLKLDA